MKCITSREDKKASRQSKESYLKDIENLIEEREKYLEDIRTRLAKDIFADQEQYREAFKKMLGWPLTEKKNPVSPTIVITKVAEEELCAIYRVSIEVLEGFSMTGLLFRKDNERKPLVIAQHGGLGTPEVVANLYGETSNYNHMIERLLQYDVNVFAPQLLIWDPEGYDLPFDRGALDARLKRVGSSITALEIYGLMRILDYFESQDYVTNFGMVGLSYGGFYTLFAAAVDTRIKSAVSCAFFSSRKHYASSDWTWFRAAETFSDAEIACLVYPRRLCIEVAREDTLFDIKWAEEEIERLKNMSKAVPEDWLDIIQFKGGHEFCWDDEPLKRLTEEIR